MRKTFFFFRDFSRQSNNIVLFILTIQLLAEWSTRTRQSTIISYVTVGTYWTVNSFLTRTRVISTHSRDSQHLFNCYRLKRVFSFLRKKKKMASERSNSSVVKHHNTSLRTAAVFAVVAAVRTPYSYVRPRVQDRWGFITRVKTNGRAGLERFLRTARPCTRGKLWFLNFPSKFHFNCRRQDNDARYSWCEHLRS